MRRRRQDDAQRCGADPHDLACKMTHEARDLQNCLHTGSRINRRLASRRHHVRCCISEMLLLFSYCNACYFLISQTLTRKTNKPNRTAISPIGGGAIMKSKMCPCHCQAPPRRRIRSLQLRNHRDKHSSPAHPVIVVLSSLLVCHAAFSSSSIPVASAFVHHRPRHRTPASGIRLIPTRI